MKQQRRLGISGRIAAYFSDSKLTPLIILAGILLGVFAVVTLPREEEPQIKVPMIDIFVQAPGMSPKEVEERVTTPMEKLLWEIPGVEYIYSTSSEGMALAVVRYYVGTNEETAVIRTYSKLYMHLDKIPPGVSMPLVKPRGIDDVPILTLTFWGEGYDHYRLRRIAAEVEREVKTSDRYSQLRRDSPREEQRVAVPHGFVSPVTLLIAFTLGIRESGVVLIAIPVTLALTLLVFRLTGFTLNRVTLFALIFSIGILVDDAIVVVENIARHLRLPENRGRPLRDIVAEAVDEVGNPTILATFTVIAAVLPMAFVRGLMGPYMRPIPIGSSAAMLFSLLVAFIITPWATLRLIKRDSDLHHEAESWTTRVYRKVMRPLIYRSTVRWTFLFATLGLLLFALAFLPLKWTTVKMLPFDNKSEFQIIIDMDEGTTLEETARVTRKIADYLATVPEVTDYQLYIGTAAPFNFNGLVRHYYLRRGSNVADIQVNLLPKHERDAQSHDIAKRVRPAIQKIAAKYGARVKIAEVPPGPPVLQTLVAEVYGPDYEGQRKVAQQILNIFRTTEGVVDADWYMEADRWEWRFVVDKEKAALHGVNTEHVTNALALALNGMKAGLAHQPHEKEDMVIFVRFPRPERSSIDALKDIKVMSAYGKLVPLSELVRVEKRLSPKSIYHKNLLPVVYVTADVAGREESPVYAILKLNKRLRQELKLPSDEQTNIEIWNIRQPFTTERWAMKWDGEWHITYEVFRNLGISFAMVLVLIYILVVGWFRDFWTPLVIMSAIPFSLVGILPAHAALGAFFTATSMIGFIAGAGIVVRNSIILVDFIELRLRQGMPLGEAVIDAGAVRFRPMLLTASAVIVVSAVILFDPIFQGLAISLMAGEVASLLLSHMAVPVLTT